MAPKRFKSANEVVIRLKSVARTMQLRMCLRPVEEQRVREALTLVTSQIAEDLKPKQNLYRDFLQHVQAVVGLYGVIICAAGLGISAVANMKDVIRVEVPAKMKDCENDILCSVLENITNRFSSEYFSKMNNESTDRMPDNRQGEQSLETQMVDHYTATGHISPYAGDAYQLTWKDAETIVGSKQTTGQVYLVETYSRKMSSFMIVPVSDEMTRLFAMQRARV